MVDSSKAGFSTGPGCRLYGSLVTHKLMAVDCQNAGLRASNTSAGGIVAASPHDRNYASRWLRTSRRCEAWERIDSLHSNSAIWPLGKRTKSLGPAVLQCLWGREYIRYTTYHKDRKAHGVSFRPAVVTLYVSRQYFPCWGYGNFRRPSYVLITSSLRKLWSWFT